MGKERKRVAGVGPANTSWDRRLLSQPPNIKSLRWEGWQDGKREEEGGSCGAAGKYLLGQAITVPTPKH